MRFQIICVTHNAPMIQVAYEIDLVTQADGIFEIDEGNLYCTGGVGEHEIELRLE